jgi:hypothetical protein
MTKVAGSGSICKRHGYADPDLDSYQNVMDPQHCSKHYIPTDNLWPRRMHTGSLHENKAY